MFSEHHFFIIILIIPLWQQIDFTSLPHPRPYPQLSRSTVNLIKFKLIKLHINLRLWNEYEM